MAAEGVAVAARVLVAIDTHHLHMAEEDSRTQSLNESNSRNGDREDDRWLQLSIGGGGGGDLDQPTTSSSRKNTNLVELGLMPSNNEEDNNGSSSSSHPPVRQLFTPAPVFTALRPVAGGFGPAFFLQHQGSSSTNFSPNQDINWAFRPVIPISVASPSTPAAAAGLYFHPQPFMAAPGVDFRAIPAPRRPHSGIWFTLQALQNQGKEPYLPQISKSYLRIKDGRMTIRLVIKYLVNKLRLESESEIEIRCKGQVLQPCLTLQQIRDNIWSAPPRNYVTLLDNASTTHHIMVLHYARTMSTTITTTVATATTSN